MKRTVLVVAALVLVLGGVGQAKGGVIYNWDPVQGYPDSGYVEITDSAFFNQFVSTADILQFNFSTQYLGTIPSLNSFTASITLDGDELFNGSGSYRGMNGLLQMDLDSSSFYNPNGWLFTATYTDLGIWTWGYGNWEVDPSTIPPEPTSPVPEPASLTLFGIGAVGAFGYFWRRRRQTA